jgi:RNA polymerase primary sigma factor
MRLVTKIAAPLAAATGLSDRLADLVQSGVFGPRGASGLARAIEKYDPASGKRFTTYATVWIRAAMRDALDEIQDVSTKGGRGHALMRIKVIRDKLATELERQPTARELKARCAFLGIEAPRDRTIDRLELDRTFVDYDMGAIPSGTDPEHELERSDSAMALKRIMKRVLNDHEIRFLTLRFGLDGGDPQTRAQLEPIFPKVDIDRWQTRLMKRLRIAEKMADKVNLEG